MIVCPVCDHAQVSGEECEVCGKRLVEALDLGATAGAERVEGLEPTLHDEAAALPGDAVAELEPTARAQVGAVATEAVPELEPTAAARIPGDGPTPEPLAVLCRYCRSPAMPGERICSHCGMRLPVAASRPQAAAEPPRCGCGLPISGPLCPSCGARHATP